jgi:hypothetical protein
MLILILALGATLAAAAPQWAVTSSLNKVFLVKYEGGVATSYQAAQFGASSLTGTGSYQSLVFVADTVTTGPTPVAVLHVGYIADPLTSQTIQWLGDPIQLAQGGDVLKQPGAVSVDANGGVYVLGGRWQDGFGNMHSNYAYITSSNGWSSANVSIVNVSSSSLADIATSGSQAMIANRNLSSGWADQTWATAVSGTTANPSTLPNDALSGYFPRGIAMGDNGFSYIANYSTEVAPNMGPSDPGVGSISVVGSNLPAIQLGSFRPTDIAFLSVGGIDYLGVVGVTNEGINQAMRLTLGADGQPILGSALTTVLGGSTDHFCSASANGIVLWATNPQANTVTAIDTQSWTASSVGVAGPAGYISAFVPEPSSIIVLLTGGIGLLGLRRWRKSKF